MMDPTMKINVLILLLFCIAASVGAASNSTTEWYTEPEEISDSIPVAITILVILILLLLICIIIVLLVCIRLLSKSTRSKDLEPDPSVRSNRNESSHEQHSYPPEQRMEPVGGHQQQQQHTPVIYVSPQSQPRKSEPQQYSIPGHVCVCNECKEIRKQQGKSQPQT
ncbi:uncharacterized protein LOC116296951 [Actinia tenebrosa]|uniref:Uncharacterized protein LOC116296951 n=1 Tax=Actinia tenebrosa TaxID=6105 RepID=A0A6P8I7A5_ACTTE|nr:uncharacterized protein LOC116296951 [Actinia tenebrosa]